MRLTWKRPNPEKIQFFAHVLFLLALIFLIALPKPQTGQIGSRNAARTAVKTVAPVPTVPTTTTAPPAPALPPHSAPQRANRGRFVPLQAPPADLSSLLDRLAMCESGMNPRDTSKNGKYLGAFQFLLSTWHAIGGEGDPRDHSYEEQKARVAASIPVSSWHKQFPVCSRRIGA